MTRLLGACVVLSLLGAACTRNGDDALVAAARGIMPSVVLLSMRIPPEHKKDGYDDAYATGFVVASGAWGSDVLTVQHAIDGAWNLNVTSGNKTRTPARVVASNSALDLALVRTRRPNLPIVRLGSSSHLQSQVGREIALLGYPVPDEFGDEGLGLATSLTSGLLSSIRKDALEVTTSIVPGDSGGPLFFTDTGEIFGLADSRFESEPSIGFGVPIDDAKKFLHKADATHGF
ncbi:MAG: serine protease [Candidatus Tumulicola sp.]